MRYPRSITTSHDVEFDTIIEGTPVTIGFERVTRGGWENYGADADGRRGEMRLEVDEDEPRRVTVEWDDERIGPFSPSFDALVYSAIAEYLERHPPSDEPDEDDERDPDEEFDYDDL